MTFHAKSRKVTQISQGDEAVIQQFLEFKQGNQGRRARTLQAYYDCLARLAMFLAGKPLLEANEDELVMFSGPFLFKEGVGSMARRPYIAATREFFRWACFTKRARMNPAQGLCYPKHGRKLPTAMDRAAAEKIMWAPDFSTFEGVRDAAMMSLLIGCGLRIGGLVALNERRIQPVQTDGGVRLVLNVTEKGGKDRRQPIPREAELVLRLYLDHPDLAEIDRTLPDGDRVLFVSTRNRMVKPHEYVGEARRITDRAVRDRIKAYGKKAGLPAEMLHPHAMRHLYGTELAESEVDILMRQNLMGHEDVQSTEIYTHMALGQKFKAVDQAGPLSKIKTPAGDLIARLK